MSTASNTHRRLVARRACLACREKKIRCDGEASGIKPSAEAMPSMCSNCRSLGIECVFVQSMRGGRRKRRDHSEEDPVSPYPDKRPSVDYQQYPQSQQPGTNSSTTTTALLPSVSDITRSSSISIDRYDSRVLSPEEPPSPGLSVIDPYKRDRYRSISEPDSRSTVSSGYPSSFFSHKSHGREGGCKKKCHKHHHHPRHFHEWGEHPDHHGPPHHGPPHHGPPHNGPPHHGPPHHGPPHHGPPHHGPLHHGPPHHGPPGGHSPPHGGPFGPPPPHMMPGYSSSSPPFMGYHGPPPSQHPQNGPPPPMASPSTILPPINGKNFRYDYYGARSSDGTKSEVTAVNAEIPSPLGSIRMLYNDQLLEYYELPPWPIFCNLVDYYYKYFYPSQQFLPAKTELLKNLNLPSDVSILYAMFANSCKFATPVNVPVERMREYSYWINKIEKNWDNLTIIGSLQVYLLLCTSSFFLLENPSNLIENIRKSFSIIELNQFINNLTNKSPSEYRSLFEISTRRQLVDHESVLRIIWTCWCLSIELRLNLGKSYNKVDDVYFEFFNTLQTPLPNSLFMFRNRSKDFVPTNWEDVYGTISRQTHDNSLVYDNISNILVLRLLQESMDIISRNGMLHSNVMKIDSQLDFYFEKANASLYEVKQLNNYKKFIVISMNAFYDNITLQVTKLIIHEIGCEKVLPFKLYENSNGKGNGVIQLKLFNEELHDQLDMPQLLREIRSTTGTEWNSLIKCINATLDIIKLIELGEGLIPENYSVSSSKKESPQSTGAVLPAFNSVSALPVLIGPTSYVPTSELTIDSGTNEMEWWELAVNHKSPMAPNFQGSPDVWLQYPSISVRAVCSVVSMLSSFLVLTRYIQFEMVNETEDSDTVRIALKMNPHVTDEQTPDFFFNVSKNAANQLVNEFKPNILLENYVTCSNFFKTLGKVSEFHRAGSVQVESMGRRVEMCLQEIDNARKNGD